MKEHSQFLLLLERRFAPFFGVQFLGALNDNVFKQGLVILLAYQTLSFTTLQTDVLQNLAQALFVLPFFIFSATAGQLADKYEKSRLISITVLIELCVMVLGAIGLFLRSLELLLAALFLSGTQSALFGPVKYAILPQHLREEELIGGNALVETGTSIAILAGLVLGGWIVAQPGWGIAGVAAVTIAISGAALALSRRIPLAPAPDPRLRINWNPVTETWRNLRFLGTHRTVFLSVLGISWFWFYGAALVTQFPNLSRNVLVADAQVVTLLLVVFSIGIGAGSLLCERMSGHKIEIGLVPFGSIGLTVFALDLYFALVPHLREAPVAIPAPVHTAGSDHAVLVDRRQGFIRVVRDHRSTPEHALVLFRELRQEVVVATLDVLRPCLGRHLGVRVRRHEEKPVAHNIPLSTRAEHTSRHSC